MQVLVVGADTAVGMELIALLTERGHRVASLSKDQCSWNNIPAAESALQAGCEVVVNTLIQSTYDAGERITADHLSSVLRLSRACAKKRMAILHLSSAFVFSGNNKNPYRETDERNNKHPLAEVLKSAENAIMGQNDQYIVLRLGPVFASVGVNVMTRMLDKLMTNEQLELSNNLRGCPVASEDAARVTVAIIDQLSCGAEPWGIYHYCSADQTSCYEFAEVLLSTVSQFVDHSVKPLVLKDETEGRRVVKREMKCDKILNTFGIKQQPWRACIIKYVQSICIDKKRDGEIK